MQTKNKPQESIDQRNSSSNSRLQTTPRKLHKYIFGLVGVLILFFGTFPLAWLRVANSEKFGDQPLNSISWGENQKANLAYPKKK